MRPKVLLTAKACVHMFVCSDPYTNVFRAHSLKYVGLLLFTPSGLTIYPKYAKSLTKYKQGKYYFPLLAHFILIYCELYMRFLLIQTLRLSDLSNGNWHHSMVLKAQS